MAIQVFSGRASESTLSRARGTQDAARRKAHARRVRGTGNIERASCGGAAYLLLGGGVHIEPTLQDDNPREVNLDVRTNSTLLRNTPATGVKRALGVKKATKGYLGLRQ